jgi:hypothetical protein
MLSYPSMAECPRRCFVLGPILVILSSIPAVFSKGHSSRSTVPDAGAASYTDKVVAITDGDGIKVMHAGRLGRVRFRFRCSHPAPRFRVQARASFSRRLIHNFLLRGPTISRLQHCRLINETISF